MMRDVLDIHTHTIVSGHAYNTMMEMAKAAADMGLEMLGITDHAPEMPGSAHLFHFANLKVVPRTLYGIPVLLGSEVNLCGYDGSLDLPEKVLRQMDVVIVSMHLPCLKPGTKEENTAAYLNAMKNPYVNIIGHPDDGRYPVDYKELVLAAGEHHKLLEVNNHSMDPGGARLGARENDMEMLRYCMEYKVPVLMSSDAHCMWDIRNHGNVISLLEEMNFPEELVVNRSTDVFSEYLNRKEG